MSMRKRIIAFASALVLGAVVTVGLTTNTLPWHHEPQQGIGSGVKITQINGVTLQDGKVIRAGDLNVLPGVIYLDHGYLDETLEAHVIEAGLGSVDALRGWGLCAAELHAEALIDRGRADAIYSYPKDAPFDRVDKNGNVASDDAAWALESQTDAGRYDAAAVLAQKAGLPCVKAGTVPGQGNYVRLTGVGKDGNERTIDVPDYSVVSPPVEYFAFQGDCAADMTANLKKVEATPVDVKIGKHGGLDTFSERDKASAIVRLKAQATMLEVANIPC